MFINNEINKKAESIKAWLANNQNKDTQITLAKKFNVSRSYVSLVLNKKYTTNSAENMIIKIYDYIEKEYGF